MISIHAELHKAEGSLESGTRYYFFIMKSGCFCFVKYKRVIVNDAGFNTLV